MSYPDLTATTLTGTVVVPTPTTVTRRVSTAYSLGVMTAQSNGLASATDTPYPMVQSVSFNGAGPSYGNLANVRGVRQSAPPLAAVAPGSASPLGDYESPYNWFTDPIAPHARTSCAAGAYRRGVFTGTSLSVTFDLTQLQAAGSTDYPYYVVSVDGGAFVRFQVPTSGSSSVVVSVASGLAAGAHSYQFMHEYWVGAGRYTSDAFSAIRILAITPSGGGVSQPATVLPKKMLLYGDSLSEGWNALAIFPAGTPPGSASSSYVQVLAHDLSCELGAVANEGQGWLAPTDVPGLATAWPNYISGVSRLTSSLLSPAPDYIVTEMGTNDGSQTDAAVRAAVTATMTAFRTAAPLAKLVIVLPFTTTTKLSAITNGFNDFVSGGGTNCVLVDCGVVAEILLTLPGNSLDGVHFTVAGNVAMEPPVESAISRALGLTSLAWKVKVENPTLVGYPQFFELDDGGNIGFFATDNTPANYTMTPFRIVDNLLFTPGWTSLAPTVPLGWLLSHAYGLSYQKQNLGLSYPTVTPAPDYFPASFVAAHIDNSGNLVATVDASPEAGVAAEIRTYTLWDLVANVAIGPPTYVNVPNRRVVAIGDQQADVRLDILYLTPFPVWQDTIEVNADQTFSVAIPAGTQAEPTLVSNASKAFLAKASMTTQFPREFFFYKGDLDVLDDGSLAYGSDFEEVTFPPYASSVVGIAMLTLLETGLLSTAETAVMRNNVRYIAMGLANIVQSGGPLPGGTPFGWLQRYGGQGPSIAYYRTGTIAWGAYFLYEALLRLPSSMWTGAYGAWKTQIETAAANVMTWCHGQDNGLNLCRFGTGRIDPVTGLFDPTYQFDFCAQEHNSDLFFAELSAFAYTGTTSYHDKATLRAAAMVTYLWDAPNTRLDQSCDALGVKSGVTSLDCYSWGGKMLNASGHSDLAKLAMPRTDFYKFTSPAGPGTANPTASVNGYTSFALQDGITDYAPSVWVEGTAGLLAAKQAIGVSTPADQATYGQLSGLQQQIDGSYRNFQLTDSDPFGITPYRSCQATAWTIIARYPNLVWWQRSL